MNGLLLTDGYKTGHHQQYPEGTEEVYSNWRTLGKAGGLRLHQNQHEMERLGL